MNGPAGRALALGIDIGGTFTDAVLHDGRGVVTRLKVPTTTDPGVGFAEIINRLSVEQGLSDSSLELLVHATTVATNAVIEGTSAPVALVVTRGFRDVLEIARQIRPDLFDLLRQKPAPLVPRDRVFEVDERIGPFGEVLRPLDTRSIETVIGQLRALNVESVVVSLLHSHANPDHERRVGEAIAAACPDFDVTVSSEVWPEFREYFRTSTAVINAAVRPTVVRYLQTIRDALPEIDLHRRFYIMQSSGGVMTADAATQLPVQLIESGPAAGVIGAAHLGRLMGWKNLLSLDIGGTTAKVGLIIDGRPRVTHEYEVGAMAASFGGRSKAVGYPIRTPVLDLVEIGAGGGSIAWVDSGRALRVGPRSAGALPGPVCYGQGGTLPTLTDANLVLGRIDPDYFLGGQIGLNVEAAMAAIENECAKPLGLGLEETARGIVTIADANMVRALRLVTVQRGHDPRDFVLVAFGGAGPLHAVSLANELQIPTVVVPPNPGVFSAAGLLLAEIQHVVTATRIRDLRDLTEAAAALIFEELEERARNGLAAQGIPSRGIAFRRFADMRYRGQSYELLIPASDLGQDALIALEELFLAEHQRQYGHATRDGDIEIVNWKVYAIASTTSYESTQTERSVRSPEPSMPRDQRGRRGTSYRRTDLEAGATIAGPAIVADEDATTWIESGWVAHVDEARILTVRPNA